MFRIHWLHQLSQRWFPHRRTARRRRTRHVSAATRQCVKPRLEVLEDRTMLTIYQVGPGDVSQLIADINAANASGGINTIELINTGVHINAPPPSYELTAVNNTTNGANGLPVIAAGDDLTITGYGVIYRDELSGTPAFRLFDVASGASLTLRYVGLHGGLAQGSGAASDGGAIYNSGNLSIDSVSMIDNTAQGGNAMGGGIFVTGGALTLNNDDIANNVAQAGTGANGGTGITGGSGTGGGNGMGGGVYVATGKVIISNDTFSENQAKGGNGGNGGEGAAGGTGGHGGSGLGGGVDVGGGTVTLNNDTFSGNQSQGGKGGSGGNAEVVPTPSGFGSVFIGNGGPGGTGGPGLGGGLFVGAGALTLTNDTLANNTSQLGNAGAGGHRTANANSGVGPNGMAGTGYGGGLFVSVGALSLANTIIANNTASSGNPDVSGAITSSDHDLIGNTSGSSGFSTSNGDLLNVNPDLGPLQDNGGTLVGTGGVPIGIDSFTQPAPNVTMALLAGSPAIDAGDSNAAPGATDERGYGRIVGKAIDIGAYEYGATPYTTDPSVSGYTLSTVSASRQITYNLVVSNDGSSSQSNVTLADVLPDDTTLVSWTPATGWSSSAPSAGSGGTVSAWIASLAGNTSATFTLVIQVNNSIPVGTPIDNMASLGPLSSNVTAGNAVVGYNASSLSIPVTAQVAGPYGAVNDGTVTFTVLDNGTSVGNSQAAVAGGQATATLNLPGLSAGAYAITEDFQDSTGVLGTASANGLLTVTSSATIMPGTATATFNTAGLSVPVTATVTSPGGTVNEGSVTFTVLTSTGNMVGEAQATVVNSQASAILSLPSLPAGAYAITESYHDSIGAFSDTSGNGNLTVNSAPTSIAANNVIITVNSSSVQLTASITSSNGVVNQGTLTFSLIAFGATVASVNASVVNGHVTVSLTLPNLSGLLVKTDTISDISPMSLPTGLFTINESYHDSAGDFSDSSGSSQLTVTSAPISTSLTAGNATLPFNASGLSVPISATVTGGSGAINQGTVTFTVLNNGTAVGSAPSSVVNGQASGTVNLPSLPAGTYTITESYHDSNGGFSDSSGNGHLTIEQPPPPPPPPLPPPPPPPPPGPPALNVPPLLAFFDSLLGGVETVNGNGTETITADFFGIPLLVSTFDSSGHLESVLLFEINVTALFELL